VITVAAILLLVAALSLPPRVRPRTPMPVLPESPGVGLALPAAATPLEPEPAPVRAAVEENVPASATMVVLGAPIGGDEPLRVVRARLAWSTLSGLGVRRPFMRGNELVNVDLIVGEDGVARAVRVGM
jgi:hypothetical protein